MGTCPVQRSIINYTNTRKAHVMLSEIIDGKLKNFSTKRNVLIGTIKLKRTPWVVELRGRAGQKNILNGNSFPKKLNPR